MFMYHDAGNIKRTFSKPGSRIIIAVKSPGIIVTAGLIKEPMLLTCMSEVSLCRGCRSQSKDRDGLKVTNLLWSRDNSAAYR